MNYVEYVAERKARGLHFVPEDKWNQYMGQAPYIPDPRIVRYLFELMHESTCESSTAGVLPSLCVEHGGAVIVRLLRDHWSLIREQNK